MDRDSGWFSFFILLFFLIVDFFYLGSYLFGDSLIGKVDTYRQFYPYFLHLCDSIRKLEIPLWWQHNGLGYPFISVIQSSSLYIPNYFFSIFPQPLGYNLSIIFHFIFLQISVFLYSLYLIKSRIASFLASLFFSFSFFIVNNLDIYTFVLSSGYFVLSLYIFHKTVDNINNNDNNYVINIVKNNLLNILIISLCLSLEFLAGYPQIFLYNIISLIIYLITFSFIYPKKITQFLLVFILFILFTLPICLPQFLATRELIDTNLRKYLKENIFNDYSYPPYMLITYIFPYIFGGTSILEYWGPYDIKNSITPTLINYISIISIPTSIIGIYAIIKKKKISFYPILVLGLISLIFSFGYYTSFHYILYLIPIYSDLRGHFRNMFQFNLFISITSILGITYLIKTIPIKRIINLILTNIIIFLLITISFFFIWEIQSMKNIFLSLKINYKYTLISLLFLTLYIIAIYLTKKNTKYIFLIILIYITENFQTLNYFPLMSINISNIIRLEPMEKTFTTISKKSKIKPKNNIIIISTKNDQFNFSIHPINYLSKKTNTRIINVYDPFVDIEYYYTFGINDTTFINPFIPLLYFYNPFLLSTYGIDYIFFESNTENYIFNNIISDLYFNSNKNKQNDEVITKIQNKKLPLEIKLNLKNENYSNLYILSLTLEKINLSFFDKLKKTFYNFTEYIEININNSYSLYYEYPEFINTLAIPLKNNDDNELKIIVKIHSKYRNPYLTELKILNIKKIKTNIPFFHLVYQRKKEKFSPVYQVWKNNLSLSNVFSVQNIQIVPDFETYLEKLYTAQFDPSKIAIIQNKELQKLEIYKKLQNYSFLNKPIEKIEFEKTQINNLEFFENKDTVEFETNNSKPSFIVINNKYYNGWKAFVNNQQIPILKTNGITQGIIIPQGKNKIILKFEPYYKKLIPISFILIIIYSLIIIISYLNYLKSNT